MEHSLTDSKEVGLAIGLILGENLLGMRDLHYGLWPEDLPVCLANFPQAQAKYTEFILSQIPIGVRRILDVGSGAGALASQLIRNGYEVDCVSPSAYLTQRLHEVVSPKNQVYPVKFEELDTNKTYDLILFSESFQYVDPRLAFKKIDSLLPFGKYIILSDFFKKNVPGTSPLGGGHSIDDFRDILDSFPYKIVREIDLTGKTAPTMEMFGNILNNVVTPVRDLISSFVQHRHPVLSKFLAWKFRRRFTKINDKYFSKKLSGVSFSEFKTYRFFLLEKKVPVVFQA